MYAVSVAALDATPYEPEGQQLPPIAELLAVATAITVDAVPDWGTDKNWEFSLDNLDGVKPGWDATAENILSTLDDERSQANEAISVVTDELLEDGDLSKWENAVAAILLAFLLGAYGLGKGGRAQVSAADIEYLRARLRNQLTYLRGFSDGILQGTLTPAQIRARAGYYPSDSRLGYDEGLRAGYRSAGWRWELNVLAAAEHCPGCLDATAQGWQPIGTLVSLGSRECRHNELCHWEFSNSVERPTDTVGLRSFVVDGWGWL